MMKRTLIIGGMIFFGLFGCGKIAAISAADFSADMVTRSAGQTMSGKIFMSGDNARMEFAEMTTITRGDKKVVWMLMPAQKTYMEQSIDPKTTMSMKEKVDGEVERKFIGNETINGRTAKKYFIRYKNQSGSGEMYQWVTDGLVMPVKTAAIDGSWSTELKNVKIGAQDASLFEIPKGYTKFSMGNMVGESMKGMLKGKFDLGQ